MLMDPSCLINQSSLAVMFCGSVKEGTSLKPERDAVPARFNRGRSHEEIFRQQPA
jgi:hypothetical protein